MTVFDDIVAAAEAGEVGDARRIAAEAIRNRPGDPDLRKAFYDLMALHGEWDKALSQLQMIASLAPKDLPWVMNDRMAIRCEMVRARVFAGHTDPVIFGEPPPWAALLIQALRHHTHGEAEAAVALRRQVREQVVPLSGSCNGDACSEIADADDRLGPILEAFVNGDYYWVPFHRVARLAIAPPEKMLDAVWASASFTWSNGGTMEGYVPVRYPGIASESEGAILLARETRWEGTEGAYEVGAGHRHLLLDQDLMPIQAVRTLELNVQEAPEEAGRGDA